MEKPGTKPFTLFALLPLRLPYGLTLQKVEVPPKYGERNQ
jgi:hypothetical protein